MKQCTFYQDVPLMKILTPNGFKKLRSDTITYCLVNTILRKLVIWAMRLSETDIFFRKRGVNIFFADTAKSIVISRNFLASEFSRKAQFPRSFVRFASNHAGIAPLHKIATQGNKVKLRRLSEKVPLLTSVKDLLQAMARGENWNSKGKAGQVVVVEIVALPFSWSASLKM